MLNSPTYRLRVALMAATLVTTAVLSEGKAVAQCGLVLPCEPTPTPTATPTSTPTPTPTPRADLSRGYSEERGSARPSRVPVPLTVDNLEPGTEVIFEIDEFPFAAGDWRSIRTVRAKSTSLEDDFFRPRRDARIRARTTHGITLP